MAAILTIGACAIPAAAQASTDPTLSGEALNAAENVNAPPYPFFLGQCSDGPASQTGPHFRFTGTASGPYPGKFSEWGTVYYDGYLAPPQNFGPVTSYHAQFRITSQRVTITGSESMVANGAQADCNGGAGGASVTIGPVTTRYTATIVTPTHRYYDHGTSKATIYQGFGLGQYWSATLSDHFTAAR